MVNYLEDFNAWDMCLCRFHFFNI